jgi:hypothetical protein
MEQPRAVPVPVPEFDLGHVLSDDGLDCCIPRSLPPGISSSDESIDLEYLEELRRTRFRRCTDTFHYSGDGSDEDFTPSMQTTAAKRKISLSGSSASIGDGQVKRSRLTSRDLHRRKAVATDPLELTLNKAELQGAAMVKVAELSGTAKSDTMNKQLVAHTALMDEQLAAQKAMNDERLTAEKVMHSETLEFQRQATVLARESNQAQQVVDFTEMFKESGETPIEEIRLAR